MTVTLRLSSSIVFLPLCMLLMLRLLLSCLHVYLHTELLASACTTSTITTQLRLHLVIPVYNLHFQLASRVCSVTITPLVSSVLARFYHHLYTVILRVAVQSKHPPECACPFAVPRLQVRIATCFCSRAGRLEVSSGITSRVHMDKSDGFF